MCEKPEALHKTKRKILYFVMMMMLLRSISLYVCETSFSPPPHTTPLKIKTKYRCLALTHPTFINEMEIFANEIIFGTAIPIHFCLNRPKSFSDKNFFFRGTTFSLCYVCLCLYYVFNFDFGSEYCKGFCSPKKKNKYKMTTYAHNKHRLIFSGKLEAERKILH